MAHIFEGLIAREQFSLRANCTAATTVDLDSVGNGTWTTGAGTLTAGVAGTTTIDTVVLADGDRVLVKNQTAAIENGIYEVSDAAGGSATVFTRTVDLETGVSATGSFAWVMEGTANLQSGWIITNQAGSDVIDTDTISWSQFDVINTLSVSRGGTGATSFTANEILLGNGTGAIGTVTAVNNAIMVTDGSGVPSFSTTLPDGLTINVQDNLFEIYDNVDNTKRVQFEVSPVPTASTTTFTVPPASTTLVGTDSTQTLTNKTITSGIYNELLDTNSAEMIIFSATGTAVNEFTVANAATGTGPTLSATGDDVNVPMNFQTKGTGVYNFLSTADAPSTIRLFEDTDNGSNSIGIDVPAAITADLTFTLPGTDGSAGDVLQTDGSGNLSFVTQSSGRVAYQLANVELTATSTTFTTVALFAWDNSRYSSYTSGTLIYEAVIANRDLDLRLQDVTGAATLLSDLAVAASAFRTVTGFTNPGADARIALQIRKSANGGTNPRIHGVQFEFVPS